MFNINQFQPDKKENFFEAFLSFRENWIEDRKCLILEDEPRCGELGHGRICADAAG